MRKTRLSRATLVAATLVVAGYGGMKAYDYSYARRVNSDDAMLIANVEALTEMESTTYLSCELTSLDECVYDCDKCNIHIKATGDLKGEHKHSYN